MSYSWEIYPGDVNVLIRDGTEALAFVYASIAGTKARVLRSPYHLTGNKQEDYDQITTVGRDALPDNPRFRTVADGKAAIEKFLGLLEGHFHPDDPKDVMQFLAKIKDLTVFGKIEIVLKIEYVNPPQPAPKVEEKKDAGVP